MKKTIGIALFLAALTVLGLTLGSLGNTTALATQAANTAAVVRTVTSAGVGEVSVKPDQTTLQLGVQTDNKDAKAAQTATNTTMNAVIAALKKAGVKDTDIKTSQYTIYPTYDYSGNKQTLTGYSVTSMVSVRIDGTDVGSIIDAATAAGANQIQSVSFGLKNESAPYQQALQKAVADAKAKADTLAKAAGCSVDVVVSIVESGANVSPVTPYYGEMRALSAAADAGGTQLMSGEMTISANVSVTYGLK